MKLAPAKYLTHLLQSTLWAYLKQPVFNQQCHCIWNPWKFFHQAHTQHLEHCFQHKMVQHLEHCWEQGWEQPPCQN